MPTLNRNGGKGGNFLAREQDQTAAGKLSDSPADLLGSAHPVVRDLNNHRILIFGYSCSHTKMLKYQVDFLAAGATVAIGALWSVPDDDPNSFNVGGRYTAELDRQNC